MRISCGVLIVVAAALLTAPVAGAQCDLFTDASDSLDPAPVGAVVTYTITVGNHGPDESQAQEIVDIELPPGVGPDLLDFIAGDPAAVAAWHAITTTVVVNDHIWEDGVSDWYEGEDSYCEALYIQMQNLLLPAGAAGNISYQVTMPETALEKVVQISSVSLDLDLLTNYGAGGCGSDCIVSGDGYLNCMGPRIGATPAVTGVVELVDDGAGGSTGCTPPVGFTPGNIALIDRRDCAFELKAVFAFNPDGDPGTADGASAVIIADHDDFTDITVDPYDIMNMACTDFCTTDPLFNPGPVVFISWADGQDVHAALDAGEEVTATLGLQESNGLLSSTGYVWEYGGLDTDTDGSNDSYLELTWITEHLGAPVAHLALSPAQPWPGDVVTISDQSYGLVLRRALWVTDGPDPAGPLVAGSTTLGEDTPTSLAFTIPLNLSQTQDFYAHVAVENDDYPYLGDQTPEQRATLHVDVDRQPQVVIEMTPALPLTGESVTLTAVYEGHPSHPASGDDIQWTVLGPDPPPIADAGATIVVNLSQSGSWTVDVAVYYRHQAADGARYVATSQQLIDASSVVALFALSPSPLVSTGSITLDGSQSRLGPAAVPSYQWQITGATTYAGCPSGPTAVQCFIPPATLNPGLHHFQLSLTDTANGDLSTYRIEDQPVIDGTVNLDFTWSPANPLIGEPITFTLLGVPDEVDGAVWTLDGEACGGSGLSDPWLCNLPDDAGCTELEYRYAGAGQHFVSVSIENAGITYGPAAHAVSVMDQGSCLHGAPSMWELVAEDGLGWPANTLVPAMAVLGGSLFVGTQNEVHGCEVWRSFDGTAWQRTATGGFGDPANLAASTMVVFDGALYVGTHNAAAGGEVWRWIAGSGWSAAVIGGFGDQGNVEVAALTVHDGELYAGTANQATGGQVWRMASDGSWTQVGAAGMGSADNDVITDLIPFNGALYAASTGYWGFRLWQLAPPDSWLQVGLDGFGDNFNERVSDMAEVFGTLILGSENHNTGTEIWQSESGDSWVQANLDGFGLAGVNEISAFVTAYAGEAYVGTSNWQSGSQVWRTDEIDGWVQSNWDGFGDQYNIATPGTAEFKGALYVGTENPFGFQIWRLNTTTLFADGFESGTTEAWQASVD